MKNLKNKLKNKRKSNLKVLEIKEHQIKIMAW